MQTIDGANLVELAYRFDPSYWGKGLAVEAAAAIVEYGFRELHLDQVIAIIDPQKWFVEQPTFQPQNRRLDQEELRNT